MVIARTMMMLMKALLIGFVVFVFFVVRNARPTL